MDFITVMSSPASPIEHLWNYLGQCIASQTQIGNVGELNHAQQREWCRIPQDVIMRQIVLLHALHAELFLPDPDFVF